MSSPFLFILLLLLAVLVETALHRADAQRRRDRCQAEEKAEAATLAQRAP